jgi:hypothetical protein
MAGGTWEYQNKKQPGFYLNMKSAQGARVSPGERGIVAIARHLHWGAPEEMISIQSPEDTLEKLGYRVEAPEMLFVRQIFRGTDASQGASQIKVFNLPATGRASASATVGALTATAKHPGVRGNDITVIVAPDPDTSIGEDLYAVFAVTTVVDGVIQSAQTVGSFSGSSSYSAAKIGDLKDNAWVNFSGSAGGALTPTAGVALTGGLDGSLQAAAYASFLEALEPERFNVLCYDGTDATVKVSVANFVKRVSFDSGRYCQAVAADCAGADSETVISVKNGFSLKSGETLTKEQAAWWVAGITAGAPCNMSMTCKIHPDGLLPIPRYTGAQMDSLIQEGSFVFLEEFGDLKVLLDINTFTGYTEDKNKAFSDNRTIRVLYAIANDLYELFARQYIGRMDNTAEGRGLFRGAIVGYMEGLQGRNAIQQFTADDVEVLEGEDDDSIVVNLGAWPVRTVAKIYLTLTIR